MSGELEAAGAMATAGLAAGAIEGREAHGAREGACLNCGAALAGPYCSQCGQAGHAHRTLLHMFEEVLHGLIHFDAKAWRTLPMLIGRPGTLTRGYTYGKRARYISPLALFLFTIFLMFFVFAFVDVDLFRVNQTQDRAEIAAELADARADLIQAEEELARLLASEEGRGSEAAVRLMRASVALARREVAEEEARLARADAAEAPIVVDAPDAPTDGAEEPDGAVGPGETRWQDELSRRAKNGEINLNTGFPELDARIVHSLENPDLALYKVQQTAYKFSFLLAPISLAFMWLLFVWRRGVTLYDHAVFVLYSLSFASVVFVVVALLDKAPGLDWIAAILLFFGMPAHMLFHLKGAYALSWWSAVWRTPFLMLSALLSLGLFVAAIFLLGLAG